ncbi:MAG TPA: SDR family oxidoreductase [Candidatus Baltobacteraceae bacterium]|jgi:NAD(P)-dependent dehydrogenase (short-subunit alcohol dehydrogenase family)|nr:SDR family oxidoreductase [Candidatus Baltobacteraceae bacterium]
MNTSSSAVRVAVITGGSQGLGKALAREFLLAGITTIVDARDDVRLDAAVHELRPYGNLIAIPGDVADKRHAHELVNAAAALGRLDILVNNASTLGEVPLPTIDQLTEQTFQRLFQVNVFAPIHLIQHSLRIMRRTPGNPVIVNITSDAASQAYATWGGYGASKAALEHVSRVLAEELHGTAIRVLVADPGDMDTQMHRDAIPDADPAELRDPANSARALHQAIQHVTEPYQRIRVPGMVSA